MPPSSRRRASSSRALPGATGPCAGSSSLTPAPCSRSRRPSTRAAEMQDHFSDWEQDEFFLAFVNGKVGVLTVCSRSEAGRAGVRPAAEGARRPPAAPQPGLAARRERARVLRRPAAARHGRDRPRRRTAKTKTERIGHAAEDPQLLDHRAHRPRQDDALRPADGADGGAHAAGDDRAVPRLDGPRAGARDHDQAALRAPALPGPGRAGVRAEPDRHARPRRFLLRGLALARGLPGGAARRRREPGRRGPDPRQRAPGLRRRARDHPRPEQDRPAGRRARAREGADRARDRDRRLGRHPGLRQDWARASTRSWRRSWRASRRPGATRTARCAASSSTRGSTSTAASWCWCTWSTGSSSRA